MVAKEGEGVIKITQDSLEKNELVEEEKMKNISKNSQHKIMT